MRKAIYQVCSALLLATLLFPQIAVAKNVHQSQESLEIKENPVSAIDKLNRQNGVRSLYDVYEATEEIPYLTMWNPTFTFSADETPVVTPPETAPQTTFINAAVLIKGGLTGVTAANQMAQFQPTAPTIKRQGTISVYANGGGFYADGNYYTTYFTKNATTGAVSAVYNRIYDTTVAAWKQTKSTAVTSTTGISTISTAMAYDVVSGKAYGCFYAKDGSGYVFASLTKAFALTTISNLSGLWVAASFDGNGTLYAIDVNGALYTVNIATGAMTKVGDTGLKSVYLTSGAIEPKSGIFYFAYINNDGENATSTSLYGIDTKTATATKLYDWSGAAAQFSGMYVVPALADDEAPAAATNITFDFANGSLSGNVEFDAPKTTYEGTEATGDITYTIKCDTVIVASGTTQYGKHTVAPTTFKTAGKQTITVTTTNSAGTSPAATATSTWIGNDTPKAPTGITFTKKDGKITISWKPVTTTANNGYMNTDSVTYMITRTVPTPVTVLVENLSDTTYTYAPEDAEIFKTYTFRVNAVYAGKTSTNATGSLTMGHIIPPYKQAMTAATSLNGYTIIDANGDGVTWTYYGNTARLLYQNKRASDDYLITPPVQLEAGHLYTFSFDAKGYDAKYFETFDVLFGSAPQVDSLNVELAKGVRIEIGQSDPYASFYYNVEIAKSGEYYFAIKGTSPNINESGYVISNALYINNIAVSAAVSLKSPQAPELTATPNKYGKLIADLEITAPTKDYLGGDLTAIDSIVILRNDVAIKTLSGIAPGAKAVYSDSAAIKGNNSYKAIAYNTAGGSAAAAATAFVGFTIPANPTVLNIKETEKVGEVKLSWSPVTTDANGLIFGEGDVTYKLYDKSYKVVAENLTDTTFTCTPLAEGVTDFVFYYLYAVDAAGMSGYVTSTIIPVGPAYNLPFNETYPDGKLYSPLGYAVSTTNMASVGLYTDTKVEGYSAYDNDNGYLGIKFWATDIICSIYTANIDLTNAKDPVYSVATYAFLSSTYNDARINRMILMVREAGATDWKGLAVYDTKAFDTVGWHVLSTSLAAYAGKLVQVGIQIQCTGMTYSFFDDMRVYDAVAPVTTLEADTTDTSVVKLNWTAPASTKYEIEGYNVYRDGKKVNTAAVTTTTYTDTPAVGTYEYYVTVLYKDGGESAPSNTVKVTVNPGTGVDAVSNAALKVIAGNSAITICGACGNTAKLYTVDGKLINATALDDRTVISVAPGIYIVKVAGKVVKVVVK